MMALTRLNSRLFLRRCIQNAVVQKRTILSDSFDLKMEWNDRLKAPLFSKVDMDKYFIDIDRQYMRDGLISHIDADIFVNSLLLSKQLGQISSSHDIETRFEQMEEILRRFRNSPETNKMLGMVSHKMSIITIFGDKHSKQKGTLFSLRASGVILSH